jgi:hypothetical protein
MRDSDDDFLTFTEQELHADQEDFHVTDGDRADWCIAKKAEALAHIEATQRQYARFIERYARWRDAAIKRDHATIERMDILLRPWFDQLKADGKLPHGRKSINYPSGTIGERWHAVEWARNDAELMPWAQPRGLVRTTEEPAWDVIKKQLRVSQDGWHAVIVHQVIDTDTGGVTEAEEVVPGVRVKQMPGHTFYVECVKEDTTHGA